MTIGMCLDYVDEHIRHNDRDSNGKRRSEVRVATQADFDNF